MADLADEQNDNAPSNGADVGADAQANQPVVLPAAPSTSSSAARQAQLVQLNDLQAKLDEQRQQTQELRAALEKQRTARGAHAQAVGRVARERILADDGWRKAHRCGLSTSSHARAIDAFGSQPVPRGTGAHRASCRVAGRELCISYALESPGAAGRDCAPRPRGFCAHTTSREGQGNRSARCKGTLGARAHRESSRKGVNL